MAAIARRQHGVVARSQLRRLGLGDDAIDHRVHVGRLLRLHQGVFAVGHTALTREARWMAAVLACGPDAVLSHWSAAALWRIRPNKRELIDVTSPSKTKSFGATRRHCRSLPPDEVTVHDGIPVTTVPRTLLDLAAVGSADVVEFALRESEYLGLFDTLSLQGLIDRYPGRRGVRKARLALARLAEKPGRVRSPLEEVFVPFLRRHDLPIPRLNAWIALDDRRYQVDCLWPNRQIVELDGWQGHGTRSAFREDRTRDRHLRVAGYSVTRLTWSQLEDEPTAVAVDLRSILTSPR